MAKKKKNRPIHPTYLPHCQITPLMTATPTHPTVLAVGLPPKHALLPPASPTCGPERALGPTVLCTSDLKISYNCSGKMEKNNPKVKKILKNKLLAKQIHKSNPIVLHMSP
jgi:hypothetical protein